MLLQTTTRGKILDRLSAVGGHIHGCGASSDDLASIVDVDRGSPFLALVPRHGGCERMVRARGCGRRTDKERSRGQRTSQARVPRAYA